MFLCAACQAARGVDYTCMSVSKGRCEDCHQCEQACNDVPSRWLPRPRTINDVYGERQS